MMIEALFDRYGWSTQAEMDREHFVGAKRVFLPILAWPKISPIDFQCLGLIEEKTHSRVHGGCSRCERCLP